MLNILIQFFSFILLANPFFFTSDSSDYFGLNLNKMTGLDTLRQYNVRQNLEIPVDLTIQEQPHSPWTYNCRLDQVADGLVQLLTVDFVLSKIIALGTCNVNVLIAYIRKKPYKKDEFAVANKMVNLLYAQGE